MDSTKARAWAIEVERVRMREDNRKWARESVSETIGTTVANKFRENNTRLDKMESKDGSEGDWEWVILDISESQWQ